MTIPVAKETITLTVQDDSQFALRAVTDADLEKLRQWKNEQHEFFFYKDEITPEQQRNWYAAFQLRPHDFMFMAVLYGQSIGCMGIRWLDNVWDVYNVILGRPEFGGRGFMGKAFNTMLAYALSVKELPITLQVLKHNPAVNWYLKNGFVITVKHDDHFSMIYQSNNNQQEGTP
jgi:RimJ/RimL family protein N-acetyltransferase